MSKIMTFFIVVIALWYVAPRVASAQWFGGSTPMYQNTYQNAGYYGTSSYNYGNNPSGWGYEPAYQGNFNNNSVFNNNCNCYRQPLIQVNLPSLFGNNTYQYQNMPYYQQPLSYYGGNTGYYPNQYGGYMQTTGSQFGYGTPTVW